MLRSAWPACSLLLGIASSKFSARLSDHPGLVSAAGGPLAAHRPTRRPPVLSLEIHALRQVDGDQLEAASALHGRHVDNAWMRGGRSDFSFTVFLSEPDAYTLQAFAACLMRRLSA